MLIYILGAILFSLLLSIFMGKVLKRATSDRANL